MPMYLWDGVCEVHSQRKREWEGASFIPTQKETFIFSLFTCLSVFLMGFFVVVTLCIVLPAVRLLSVFCNSDQISRLRQMTVWRNETLTDSWPQASLTNVLRMPSWCNMCTKPNLLVTVIVKLIVTAQSCQTPLTNPKREKDLCPCVHPNLSTHEGERVEGKTRDWCIVLTQCLNFFGGRPLSLLLFLASMLIFFFSLLYTQSFVTYLRVHQLCRVRIQVEAYALMGSW